MKTGKLAFIFLSASMVLVAFTMNKESNNTQAKAAIEEIAGSGVSGTATFTQQDGGGVEVEITVEGLSAGQHAVHLHTGTCDNIGNHWNPTQEAHGKREGGEQFHRGDIGNIEVGNNGKGTFSLTADDWSIGGEEATNVLNKLVIIHAGADDFTSQPSGNAGDKIGCGVIQ